MKLMGMTSQKPTYDDISMEHLHSFFFRMRLDSIPYDPMEEDGNDEKEARANGQPFVFLTICDVGPLYIEIGKS